MIEVEWLTSTDPLAMLRHLTWQPSDRKLQLWMEAVASGVGRLVDDPDANTQQHLTLPLRWAVAKHARITFAAKAALLREIVGNPFQTVTLPASNVECPACQGRGWLRLIPTAPGTERECMRCRGSRRVAGSCPWLTPTVVSLVQAAYDDHAGRTCPTCRGVRNLYYVPATRFNRPSTDEPIVMGPSPKKMPCDACHGTGRVGEGTLDPVRLSILADALTDAGCDCTPLLMHLRGRRPCTFCGGFPQAVPGGDRVPCMMPGPGDINCREVDGWHVLDGPHVRGCWAVDLILGMV